MTRNTSFHAGYLIFRPIAALFSGWVQPIYRDFDPRDTATNNIDGCIKLLMRNKWHPLHTSLYMWNKSALVNNLLSCLGHRLEMRHSVESRTPILDHHLTEDVNTLPPSLKVRGGIESSGAEGSSARASNQKASPSVVFTEKWILHEATKPFITDEVYRRRKHPYTAPTALYIRISVI
jgi:asparagine synthase (glutamine-hydrolysing)